MFSSLEDLAEEEKARVERAFAADPRPHRMLLLSGMYRDDDGRADILPFVAEARRRVLEAETTKPYLPIGGSERFLERVGEALFAGSIPAERRAGVQTPGGTGALRLLAELAAERAPGTTVYVGTPVWGNLIDVARYARVGVRTHPWPIDEDHRLDLDRLFASWGSARPGDAVLLQAACQNPTGIDPDPDQWRAIGEFLAAHDLLPVIDVAFVGFSAPIAQELAGACSVVEATGRGAFTVSLAKTFALYDERPGAVFVVGPEAREARNDAAHLRRHARRLWSSPPAHGARVIEAVLGDPTLRGAWSQHLEGVRRRIDRMRRALATAAAELAPRWDPGALLQERGLFTRARLDATAVTRLREEHAVHLGSSAIVNVCAVGADRVRDIAAAIGAVT